MQICFCELRVRRRVNPLFMRHESNVTIFVHSLSSCVALGIYWIHNEAWVITIALSYSIQKSFSNKKEELNIAMLETQRSNTLTRRRTIELIEQVSLLRPVPSLSCIMCSVQSRIHLCDLIYINSFSIFLFFLQVRIVNWYPTNNLWVVSIINVRALGKYVKYEFLLRFSAAFR